MLKNETYTVVVKKFYDVGIKKVRFVGLREDCTRWMTNHRWGYYELLGPDGLPRSYLLG